MNYLKFVYCKIAFPAIVFLCSIKLFGQTIPDNGFKNEAAPKNKGAKAIRTNLTNRHDSALIIFKNVTTDTMLSVHAIIKNQFMFNDMIAPNGEYRHKIRSDSTCSGHLNTYRFHVIFPGGQEASILPSDYFDEVSKMDIKTGTYIYYIGRYDREGDGRLHIRLVKLK